jgi:prevent-host-death family protein
MGQREGHLQWTIGEAKAKFNEVIKRAQQEGPQRITRSGEDTAVVVSAEEWSRINKRKGSLSQFFADSPLRGAKIEVKRKTDLPRNIERLEGMRRLRGKIKWQGNLEESRRS